ncbi:POT family proton-dependent oligopeptide transporter [Arcicella aurantiaca]|uniref:POT family proton-dependent oligopeptide transporter n=1 Tax=Arcicella aurantiaca TaxID=591202 RepID=A0A316EKG3_9BACT|nr:POT family MFS transporter [Arcicella aurantiaca]PWK29402.1 POT family proton-dependent oligopeptide transporter [Arcicella aurantiaca]
MSSTSTETEVIKSDKYPAAIPYIIGNEAAERFSFYGMRAILPIFLVAQFFNPTGNPALQTVAEAKSNAQVHIFVALAYATPMIGAALADWFFGKYKVILYVSIIYCIGHLFLALYDTDLQWFGYGLTLIAVGAGGIKSCVSANVGDQFDKSNEHLMSKVYGWFYFAINSGSVLSNYFIPELYKNYGASVAFGVPGILMALATLIFWLGRKKYVIVPPTGFKPDFAKLKEGFSATGRVLLVFAFIPLFWAMWDQNLSEWILQAGKLDLELWKGHTILSGQVQLANPVFLVSFLPVFTYVIYPNLEKLGVKVTPLRKIGVGLALTGLSFVIIAQIQDKIDAGGHPSVWNQILGYLILAWGEILVWVTCLEYAYTNSPKFMKSIMGAIGLLTVALGNFLVALMNESISKGGYFAQYTGASYYWFFVKLMAIELIIFILVSKFIKEKRYVGED